MRSGGTALPAGTLLQGTYEIVGLVAVGGMSEIYEARHARLPGRYAVKVLTGPALAGSSELLRFRREAEIASSLRHPHIVQVLDFHETDEGVPYLVMELLEGNDLAAELLREGPLPVGRVVSIVEQSASALAAAHGRGVIHRDLKPQNLFLARVPGGSGDYVKLLDFGISKVKTAATITAEAKIMGTPQYMAPEQADGRAAEIDGRTDQFALAAIAYELLTGVPAFAGDSVPRILFRIVQEEPAPLGALVPAAAALAPVIGRAMAKRPADRYYAIALFAEALRQAADGLPPRAPAASPLTVTSPPRDRGASTGELPAAIGRKRWPWALALGLAVVVPGLALTGAGRKRPAPEGIPGAERDRREAPADERERGGFGGAEALGGRRPSADGARAAVPAEEVDGAAAPPIPVTPRNLRERPGRAGSRATAPARSGGSPAPTRPAPGRPAQPPAPEPPRGNFIKDL